MAIFGQSRSSKTGLKSALLLLVLTVGFYWKIMLGHEYSMLLGSEGVNQAYAWLNFWVATVRQGVWPLWDPFTFSGHAFAGEMQTGAFYPPYLFFLVGPFHQGLVSPQLYHVFYVLTHALCAWFMYLLARQFRLSAYAGVVAGVCFSLGGDLVRVSGWPHLFQSGIWLPLIVMLLLRALKSVRVQAALAWSSLSGLSLAMAILAGGLHLVIMDAIVIASAVIFYAATMQAENHDAPREWNRAAIVFAVCAAFAFAGGAVQLLPSAEYSHLAFRYLGAITLPATEKIPYKYMGDALWPHGFLGLLVPSLAGNASSGEYINPYMGVFPLLLAIIGIWKRWEYLWVRYFTGLIAAACLYSLGSLSLLHGFLYAVTPYLWLAREANRFMYLTDFGLTILAAFGVDALFSNAEPFSWEPLTRVFKWIALAGLIALAYPFILGRGDQSPWISLSLLLILLTYGLCRYIVQGHYGRWARFLILALILFDLSAFDWSAANKIEQAAAGHDEMSRLLSFRGAADFLRSKAAPFRVQLPFDFAPNIGDMYGIEETTGAGVTIPIDYDRIRGHAGLLNARYTIRPATAKDPGAIYEDGAWKIYENQSAYPRAWLVHAAEVEPNQKQLLTDLDAPGVDLHRVAFLEAPLSLSLDAPSGANQDQAQWRKSRQDRVEVNVHANGRALLVLSEVFYPGWEATVNGSVAQILKVDGALRGIVVPDGDSLVSLVYSPGSFLFGLALSVLAFATGGFLGLWFCSVRRTSTVESDPKIPLRSRRRLLKTKNVEIILRLSLPQHHDHLITEKQQVFVRFPEGLLSTWLVFSERTSFGLVR